MKVQVDGQEVEVGAVVGFKCDVEQTGTIKSFKKSTTGHRRIVLENVHGFEGEYIGGDNVTTVYADDCWII